MNTMKRQLPVLSLSLVAACGSGDSLGSSSQALVAECADDADSLPGEDVWVCGESLEIECDTDVSVDPEVLYVVPTGVPDGNAFFDCTAPLSISDSGPFAPGTYVIDVSVDAEGEDIVVCSAELTVTDTTPPELTPKETMLWPPNHKMHTIEPADCVEVVDCDPDVELRFVSVTSDEAVNAKGDGNTEPDVVVDDCGESVQLRAERQGGGDGRVYTLMVEATDSEGQTSEASCTVVVPHDMSGREAVDSGVVETTEIEGC